MIHQRTLREKVDVVGIGLHTGKPAKMSFRPAPVGTGIYFIRKDLPGSPALSTQAEAVTATNMATTLGGELFSVSTVEHCLSAVAALRIDNLYIELEGPEIPIGDGSAEPFLRAIQSVGLIDQDAPRKYIYVTRPVYFQENDKQAYILPYNGLRVQCTIEFPHPRIGRQSLEFEINEASFAREIAGARTFGFMKDVEELHRRGLALGGSLQNAVVLDEKDVLNPEGLRWQDEFVRHKILDALGDLVTLGMPLLGHVVLHKAGHDVMNKLVRQLLNSPDAYRYVELGPGAQ